ncbi:helix-turn-helix transcriptional regulator [Streptomyces sp. NPDC002793]|uniref:helix-turn-helix transcriptional regulator n=1 Tax=Streptomyces sp. NPDC002793 TaxID=3154432 RepID=UPI00331E1A21
MRPQGELGDFLRSRRARIRPEDAGFASGAGVRRVPGLRREELSHLAGVSVDYYVRLEQGRNHSASDAVLGAIADALRLDGDERAHLFRLARPRAGDAGGREESGEPVRAEVRRLLDWISAPALAIGRRMDVLAWNRPAGRLITDFGRLAPRERNLCRLHLVDTEIGSRYPDRDLIAQEVVGHLRIAAGIHPDDPLLWELVDELKQHCAEFVHHWSRHTVRTKSYGVKRVNHPDAGPLALTYEITHFPQDPELSLLVYTAAPGTAEEAALRMMGEG